MQTLVFTQNTGDDELDLRQFVGKDTDLPRSERFKSPYVLFAPGYRSAPPELRGAGRLSVEVTNDMAEELLTHPTWRFVKPEIAAEVDRRARARFAEELPEIAAARNIEADRIGPAIEVAPTAPATVAAVRAEAKSASEDATKAAAESAKK